MKCPYCGHRISDELVLTNAARIRGKRTARRGPEYYRQLQAKRKVRKGGRPRKKTV